MKWTNDITRILNIGYPIIQAPMFGVSTPAMAAAAAKAGSLGSLALADLPADKCAEAIHATRQLTSLPFAVNIFVHNIPDLTDEIKLQYAQTRGFIETLAHQHGLDCHLPALADIRLNTYHEQIDAVIAAECSILSFTFGNPDPISIAALKDKGILLIGTATSVEEALVLERSDIDLICVQGIEAGGHRGSFLSEPMPAIGGISLLSQIADRIKKPLIYAGGIYNAKTLLAAQTLGAQGFQIGSLLLGSKESALQDFEKQRLRTSREADNVLTKSFSGRYARGLRNEFTDALDNSPFILPYPYQNKLTNELRRIAKASQNADFVSIWAGQSRTGYSGRSTTEILEDLIAATEKAVSA